MLPRWYPNIRDAADGNFIERHIRCISGGINVRILFVLGLEKKYKDRIDKKNNDEHYVHYYSNIGGIIGGLINPLRYFLYQLRLFRAISEKHGLPLLCHVHVMARSSLLANYLKLRYGIPFVVSEHWMGYYSGSKAMSATRKLIYNILYRNADAVSAVSESLLEAVKPYAPTSTTVVIPNIVEKAFFAPLLPYDHKSYFVHISNLKSVKQTDRIISMLDELSGEGKDITLILVGDGPERKRLEDLASRAKSMQGKIEFRGQVEAGTLAGIIAGSAAVLSFSSFETQSIVLLEAISLGIPVIAPDIGGIPEHCRGRGILFPVNSEASFKEALLRIKSGQFILDRNEGRDYALRNFSEEVVQQKFLNLYHKVIKH